MTGLLDFIQSPGVAAAAGLLTPTVNSRTGPGLLQGIQAANRQGLVNNRTLAGKQAIQNVRNDAERRRQSSLIAQGIRTGQIPIQQGLTALASLSDDPSAAFSRLAPKPQAAPNIVRVAQSLGFEQGTPEFNDFVTEATLKPQNQISIGSQQPFKLEPGFMLANPSDPASGVVAVPGGSRSRKTPTAAAKTAMISNALELVPVIRNQIMPRGKVDRGLVATLSMNAPFSEGRLARQRISDAVEAKLRAESGAAVPETEVTRAAARFIPSPLDSDDSIEDKMNRLEKFLGTSLKLTDPELFGQLNNRNRKKKFSSEATKIGDQLFIKDSSGDWFEVTHDGS